MHQGKNRYDRRSRISEKVFRRLRRAFALDLTATSATAAPTKARRQRTRTTISQLGKEAVCVRNAQRSRGTRAASVS